MDSLNPEHPPVVVARVGRRPLVWKFWGTVLWGLFIFAAMFIGQIAVVAWFVLRQGGPIDVATAVHVVGGGITISLSVICGLPAVLAALWLAIHLSRTPFADYLALRGTSWKNLLIGIHGHYRNPRAHRTRYGASEQLIDFYDLFGLLSYTHRRLDTASRTCGAGRAGRVRECPSQQRTRGASARRPSRRAGHP